ncbi:MAG: hypothetical protein FWG44_06980 [Oscillospiraceae bacterium]|nr:hypothetical protein [Oscillospiraceae bacterium]
MTIQAFESIIKTISEEFNIEFSRNQSHKASGKRLVWKSLAKKFQYAEGEIIGKQQLGQVDYYTDDDDDTFPDLFEVRLSANRVAVASEFSGQWDDITELNRHTWTVEF